MDLVAADTTTFSHPRAPTVRSQLERVRVELGDDGDVIDGFRARHGPPSDYYIDSSSLVVDVVVNGVLWLVSKRRRWSGIEGVPRSTVAVGVTRDQLLIGRDGDVILRQPLDGAIGRISQQLPADWIEVCGVKLWVQGPDADGARRVQRRHGPTVRTSDPAHENPA